jgi:hypothetical protein
MEYRIRWASYGPGALLSGKRGHISQPDIKCPDQATMVSAVKKLARTEGVSMIVVTDPNGTDITDVELYKLTGVSGIYGSS